MKKLDLSNMKTSFLYYISYLYIYFTSVKHFNMYIIYIFIHVIIIILCFLINNHIKYTICTDYTVSDGKSICCIHVFLYIFVFPFKYYIMFMCVSLIRNFTHHFPFIKINHKLYNNILIDMYMYR